MTTKDVSPFLASAFCFRSATMDNKKAKTRATVLSGIFDQMPCIQVPIDASVTQRGVCFAFLVVRFMRIVLMALLLAVRRFFLTPFIPNPIQIFESVSRPSVSQLPHCTRKSKDGRLSGRLSKHCFQPQEACTAALVEVLQLAVDHPFPRLEPLVRKDRPWRMALPPLLHIIVGLKLLHPKHNNYIKGISLRQQSWPATRIPVFLRH
mgnify:CR=1 FL=1